MAVWNPTRLWSRDVAPHAFGSRPRSFVDGRVDKSQAQPCLLSLQPRVRSLRTGDIPRAMYSYIAQSIISLLS
jgi:hypothetical protein